MSSGETSALWDWDSILLQATPILDPTGELQRHEHELQHEKEHEQDEHDQEEQQQNRRRRDPRLTCPNYLAGRVPCACSDEEDEEEQGRNKKRSKQLPGGSRCQVPACGADLAGLKGYHQRHKVCLQCANSTSVFVRNQEQRYCQQCGKFHPLSSFDEGKRSCRFKLEKHNDNRKRRSGKNGEASNNATSEGTTTNLSDEALSEAVAVNAGVHSLDPFQQQEECKEGDGEEFLATDLERLLQESPIPEIHVPSNGRKTRASTRKNSNNAYNSPCPTRRISFKFYDWNPADFPRRLREQILEWLANMPVELEGYIRSGCTILTLFIAMPESAWVKLHQDWEKQLAKLIHGSESGFWDTGFATVFFDDKVSYVDHGIISSAPACDLIRKKRLPVLEGAIPICIEAGVEARVTVFGQNLQQRTSSLLVGSEGKYLASFLIHDTSSRLQVNVLAPQNHGVALFEVKTNYGVSNFVPVLVADRKLCEEVGSLVAPLEERQHLHDFVQDLGWVLRNVQDPKALPVGGCPSGRLQELLAFSMARGWVAVTDRILQAMRKPPGDSTVRLQLLDDDYWTTRVQDGPGNGGRGDGVLASSCLITHHRRQRHYFVKAALCLVIVCTCLCILLQQHPRQVLQFSTSLRRCLTWTTAVPRMGARTAGN